MAEDVAHILVGLGVGVDAVGEDALLVQFPDRFAGVLDVDLGVGEEDPGQLDALAPGFGDAGERETGNLFGARFAWFQDGMKTPREVIQGRIPIGMKKGELLCDASVLTNFTLSPLAA